MKGTRMENRVEELESGLRTMDERIAELDSKLGSLTQLVEKGEIRFDSLDAFMGEIRVYMNKESKGKEMEIHCSPPGDITDRSVSCACEQLGRGGRAPVGSEQREWESPADQTLENPDRATLCAGRKRSMRTIFPTTGTTDLFRRGSTGMDCKD